MACRVPHLLPGGKARKKANALVLVTLLDIVVPVAGSATYSHTFTTPSPEPLATLCNECPSTAIEYTPSTWPLPSCATKGLANSRSSLTALRARVYSLARSNGCSSGLRFRGALATSEPAGCTAGLDRVFTFYSEVVSMGVTELEVARVFLPLFFSSSRGDVDVIEGQTRFEKSMGWGVQCQG
jgi:hypothetical protein